MNNVERFKNVKNMSKNTLHVDKNSLIYEYGKFIAEKWLNDLSKGVEKKIKKWRRAFMKIAFWSNGGEKMCVTSNMACIASMLSLRKSGKVREILLENHFNKSKSLEDILLQPMQQNFLRESGGYNVKYGLEYVLKRIYCGEKDRELIKNSTIDLMLSNMFLLPSGMVFNKEVFNYDFSMVHRELFKILEEVSEYIFIDTESNQNLSTKQILFDADIVVVNLTQKPDNIRDFFENYTSIREKAIYIIGKYRSERMWTRKKISYEYNVPRNRIGIMPYTFELEDAIESGKVQQYLCSNYFKATSRENEFFIRQCKKNAKIIESAALEVKKNRIRSLEFQKIDNACKENR